MASAYIFVIVCGLLALAYGLLTSRSVLAANAGNAQSPDNLLAPTSFRLYLRD